MRTMRSHPKEVNLDEELGILRKNFRPVMALGQREIKEGL